MQRSTLSSGLRRVQLEQLVNVFALMRWWFDVALAEYHNSNGAQWSRMPDFVGGARVQSVDLSRGLRCIGLRAMDGVLANLWCWSEEQNAFCNHANGLWRATVPWSYCRRAV